MPVVAVVGLAGLIVAFRRRYPPVLAVGLAFGALVLPVSGLMQSGRQAVADRFVYLALVPVTIGAVGGGIWLWRRLTIAGRVAVLAVTICELAFFAVRSREQIAIWHDDLSLWENAWSHYQDDGVINFHMAVALTRRGRFSEALPYAINVPETLEYNGAAPATLGMIYLRLQRPAEAVPALERSLVVNAQQRGARFNLACAYALLGQTADARRQLKRLLTEFPEAGSAVRREPVLQQVLTP